MTPYLVPSARQQTTLVVNGSRFIATADLAASVDAARALPRELRRLWPDATHHVYAFAVGQGSTVVHGMSDDGEPSGTAGRPVLAVVKGSGLGDVCVVVTRYFGGTKLGTGGLVRAYTEAAQAVLSAVPRQLNIRREDLSVCLTYPAYDPLLRLAGDHHAEILSTDFADAVTVTLRLAADAVPPFEAAVGELTAGRAVITRLGHEQPATDSPLAMPAASAR